MTGLLIFAVFGMASAGKLGGHGDDTSHHHHHHHHIDTHGHIGPGSPLGPGGHVGPSSPLGPDGHVGPSSPLGPGGHVGPSSPLGPDGHVGTGPSPGTDGGQVIRTHRILYVTGIMTFDKHACIFRNGEIQLWGPELGNGEEGLFQISSGIATLESGHRVSLEGGLVHIRKCSDIPAITQALSRTGITAEQFLERTGPISHQEAVIEVTAGVISISGTYRNINTGVMVIVHSEQVPREPGTQVPTEPIDSLVIGPVKTLALNGIMTFDRHACVVRSGVVQLRGPELGIGIGIGEEALVQVLGGFYDLYSGDRVSVGSGLVAVHVLHLSDTSSIRSVLSRTGITPEQFFQNTSPIPSMDRVIELTAGVVSIGGTYMNVNVGLLFMVPLTSEPATGHVTVVTETAAPETLTVSQPVTLIKTSTRDEYITITSPVYNSVDATFTNFIRRTRTVSEEQVIRSPVAGKLIVTTLPVSTHTILTLTDTATNYFVKTDLVTVTSTLQHLSSNFVFSTIIVNNIITSTVVQTITRTDIVTVSVTNTVGSTVYSTAVITVTLSHGPATTPTPVPTVPTVYY